MSECKLIDVMMGGPVYPLRVGKKKYLVELHPVCGPTAITKLGDPLRNQPTSPEFWERAQRLYDKYGKSVYGQ